MMKVLSICAVSVLSAASMVFRVGAADAVPPSFTEVYQLVRSNLFGVTEEELNRAAVQGLIGQLHGQVDLATNGVPESSAIPLVSKSAAVEGAYGFIRIGRVASGLSQAFATAFEQLNSSNKLNGLVVDLRFAVGRDYASAAQTANLFFKEERPLLNWGEKTFRSTVKPKAIELPAVVLINNETRGAAEALAAALRQGDGALLIGSATAGQAHLFKEFTLSTGQSIRIASGMVAVGEGQPLAPTGVAPDIQIAVNPADEKAYFEDPYKVLPRAFAQAAKPNTPLASMQGTNRFRRPRNEAELVRMQSGLELESERGSAAMAPFGPVMTDPALSRGLDVLKGLALVLKRR